MKRFFITIVNPKTFTVHNLHKTEAEINATIEKELGGYGNLFGAMTSDGKGSYMHTGFTKNQELAFSIMCLVDNRTNEA